MQLSHKPVRKCHSCLLNQGDHCWGYRHPRAQWRDQRRCPGFENEPAYCAFRLWQKQASVKTRKEIRQEVFRTNKPELVFHLEPEPQPEP